VKPLWAVALMLAVTGTQATPVYKCTDANGKLTFSQQPCEGEAGTEVIEVKHTTHGVDFVAEGDFSKVEAENTARASSRQRDKSIAIRQRNLSILRNERDAKIARLRAEQNNTRNNAAGAAYHGSLATEIQTITQDYRSRIQAEEDAIARLREQY